MKTHIMKKKLTAAYHYSLVRLALNFDTCYEILSQRETLPEDIAGKFGALKECLKKFLTDEPMLEELNPLREQVGEYAEILVRFLDYYRLYERVMSSRKGKYEVLMPSVCSDEELTRRACNYITGDSGERILSGRLAEILECLPVRMTKQKYIDYLTEGLLFSVGQPVEILHGILDKWKERLNPFPNETLQAAKPDRYLELKHFEAMDYRDLTFPAYEANRKILETGIDSLVDEIELADNLQEMINDLYVVALTMEDAVISKEVADCCRFVLLTLLQDDGINEESDDFLMEQFRKLEGIQEAYGEQLLQLELPSETKERLKDEDYVRVLNVDLLHSGSRFMKLRSVSEEGKEEAALKIPEKKLTDRPYLDQQITALLPAAEERFSGTSRFIVRVIMMNTLLALPFFLLTFKNLHSFIQRSLDCCQDEGEKNLCKRNMEKIMDEWKHLEAGFDDDEMEDYEDCLV